MTEKHEELEKRDRDRLHERLEHMLECDDEACIEKVHSLLKAHVNEHKLYEQVWKLHKLVKK